jgi:hypothetical protein
MNNFPSGRIANVEYLLHNVHIDHITKTVIHLFCLIACNESLQLCMRPLPIFEYFKQ